MELNVDFQEQKLLHLEKRRIKMRIAICDDDIQMIRLLKPLIYRYANEHRYDFVIEEFYSGEALLNSDLFFDIILLDYKMNALNGLDTAKQLRKNNSANTIIFITSYTHFVFDAFTVNAFRFLVKPITEKKIHETLDDYFSMYGNDYPILLKSDRETFCIDTKDIVFLEADNKHCIIHLASQKTIRCAKTMATVNKLMPRNHFYKINRAFIVNFNYISRYNSDEIIFSNGEHVHISRNYLTAFKVAYRNYCELQR